MSADGQVSFHAYLDRRTHEAPAHVVDTTVLGPNHTVIEHWDASALSKLPYCRSDPAAVKGVTTDSRK
jgi:hypothetical protein